MPYVITTPKELVTIPKESRKEFMKDKMWHITAGTAHGAFTTQKLIEYVNKKTKRDIKYTEPIINLII